jgi:C_GCAxxG_C_C family probable redox protein
VDADTQGSIEVAALIGERARNLFLSRQMYCSEAVLVTLNQGLGGSLEEYQARALAAPFSQGVGKTGCMCGALGGALMALGLFIGGQSPVRLRATVQQASGDLLKRFKTGFGSSCCRVLSKKSSIDSKPHFDHCSELTARAATLATEVIFAHRPELVHVADFCFLNTRDSAVGGLILSKTRCAARAAESRFFGRYRKSARGQRTVPS